MMQMGVYFAVELTLGFSRPFCRPRVRSVDKPGDLAPERPELGAVVQRQGPGEGVVRLNVGDGIVS